jgi:hypothetical protein
VVADRHKFLQEIQEMERTCGIHRVVPDAAEVAVFMKKPRNRRPYVIIVHDESTCSSNDDQSFAWVADDDPMPRLKSKSNGAGIMVSAFITEVGGGILSFEDQKAVEYLEYGSGNWWNSPKMVAQLKIAIEIAEKAFPWAQLVWRFDHSSNHKAMPSDALNASTMNVGSGGKQPLMRDGEWNGTPQSMVHTEGELKGKPKGLATVLRERNLYPSGKGSGKKGGIVQPDLVKVLRECPDFKTQGNIIEELLKKASDRNNVTGLCTHTCRFYPKYHCELSPIERFWAAHKRYVRSHCDYNIAGLRIAVVDGLDAICADTVRRFFAICRRYEVAYRSDIALAEVEAVVKKYTSHRRVLDGTGIVARLLAEGQINDSTFDGLCSCNKCTGEASVCQEKRCTEHRSDTELSAVAVTDRVRGKKPKRLGVAKSSSLTSTLSSSSSSSSSVSSSLTSTSSSDATLQPRSIPSSRPVPSASLPLASVPAPVQLPAAARISALQQLRAVQLAQALQLFPQQQL